jgi:hypothetical protein
MFKWRVPPEIQMSNADGIVFPALVAYLHPHWTLTSCRSRLRGAIQLAGQNPGAKTDGGGVRPSRDLSAQLLLSRLQ